MTGPAFPFPDAGYAWVVAASHGVRRFVMLGPQTRAKGSP